MIKLKEFLKLFGVIVVILTADTPKLELRVTGKLKCESFESCEKCAQNNWGGGHNGAKTTKFDHFGGVVSIATADTPNLELRVCVVVKCELFETYEKCAQNFWGDTNALKYQFLTIWGVVAMATADTPKLELRVCVEVKCESFETCEKCAQNFWGDTNAQNTNF